jgi:hypothetical protein
MRVESQENTGNVFPSAANASTISGHSFDDVTYGGAIPL